MITKSAFIILFICVLIPFSLFAQGTKHNQLAINIYSGINYYYKNKFIAPTPPNTGSVHRYDAFNLFSAPGIQMGAIITPNNDRIIKFRFGAMLFNERSLYYTDSITLSAYNLYVPHYINKIISNEFYLEAPLLIAYKFQEKVLLSAGVKLPAIYYSHEKFIKVRGNNYSLTRTSFQRLLHFNWPLTLLLEANEINKFGFYGGIDYRNYRTIFYQLGLKLKLL
jgi:hypothetical protein